MTNSVTNEALAPVERAQAATNYVAIRVEQSGPVLAVTLNRPEARNAMSLQMVAELRQALAAAEATAGHPGAVRAVVLRGAGGHFCAGADLKDMAGARMRAMQAPASAGAPASDPIAEVNAAFGELCVAYSRTPLAVVAVLEGTVMGGGFGLACVADVALASDTAAFRLPETSLGVVPAQIAPFLVERLGYSQAKRLAVTGGRLDAAAALRVGLVHAVVHTEELQAELNRVLADILACAPGALAATKALMAQARLQEPQTLVQHAAAVFSQAAQGPEGLEGMTAFMQKRKPNWVPV
ncbi:MAG: enoyl-CoA hydratase/isomerase family protein [Burkholderiales bacterium]|nr:enoyl-CoA hydratase/isomerase family protein [Burkholderiales bacterium]